MKRVAVCLVVLGGLVVACGCATSGVEASAPAALAQAVHSPVVGAVAAEPVAWEASAYFWGPAMDGDVAGYGGSVDVKMDLDEIPDEHAFGLGLHLEAAPGPWRFLGDLLRARVGDDDGEVMGVPLLDVDVDAIFAELAVGYAVWDGFSGNRRGEGAGVDLFAGGRYNRLDVDAEMDIGPAGPSINETLDWVDPMVGARVTWRPAEDWELGLRGDVAGFGLGSELTWNAIASLGYYVAENLRLSGGYRVMDIDYDEGSGYTDLEVDIRLAGPWIGLAWLF